MPVALRLQRFGARHRPFFRIVAADQRSPRDGKHLERLGTYDPIPRADGSKVCSFDFARIRHWLAAGAQPTERVAQLLGKAGLTPTYPKRESTIRAQSNKEGKA